MNKYGKESLLVDNAGGNSEISEAWSISYLMDKIGANECIYEMNVRYIFNEYKMVDYIISVNNSNTVTRIGVSVTRAICSPYKKYTREEGIRLLKKKLEGLVISKETVCGEQNFYQSILHIWVPNINVANLLKDIIITNDVQLNDLEINGTLDVWITVSDYLPLYNNGRTAYHFKYKY